MKDISKKAGESVSQSELESQPMTQPGPAPVNIAEPTGTSEASSAEDKEASEQGKASIDAYVDERYGRMLDAFAPGTEVLRSAIASAFEARIPDIVEFAARKTEHHKATEPVSAYEIADWEQATNATRGLQLIARWIATGEVPSKARLDSIAVTGRRALTVTGQISRIIGANLACRDGALAVVTSLANELGTPPKVLGGLVEGINFAIERALLAMAKEFDSELALERKERDSMRELWEEMAVLDPTSGLYNERSFLDLISARLQDRRRGSQSDAVAIIWLRLQGLAPVGQGTSKSQLDEIVSAIAGRLKRLARPMDIVARTGELEYALFCSGIPFPRIEDTAVKIAKRALGSLAHPVRTSQGTLQINGRAVATWATGPLQSAENLLKRSKEVSLPEMPSGNGDPLAVQVQGSPAPSQ